MAWLDDVPFDEAAALLGTSPARLSRWLRGEETVPRSKEELIAGLTKILIGLRQVLEPSATYRWLKTPIPALSDKTPAEVIEKRGFKKVVSLVQSYLDPSFG